MRSHARAGALAVLWLSACNGTTEPHLADAAVDAAVDASVVPDAAPLTACNALFGRPSAKTGLSSAQCAPECSCNGETWRPREIDQAELDALATWTIDVPFDAPAADPYTQSPPQSEPGTVCAVHKIDEDAKTYRLQTYASADAARAAGGIVTHADACGLCSTLADFIVYARENDLTAPVRSCALSSGGDFAQQTACIEAIGFSHPCALIWSYNANHTRDVCAASCFRLIDATYNEPDGDLNACLQCDEDMSGDVFKFVAGRTRRNTGLPNSICRPCEQVIRIDHDYL